MSANPSSTPDALAIFLANIESVHARFEKLNLALDEALVGESAAPVKRSRKAPLPFANRFGKFTQSGSAKILSAMCLNLLGDTSLLGAIFAPDSTKRR